MKTIEYATKDKTKWGDGPWQNEPDKRQWMDETTGLPCIIRRGGMGAWCGYVGVSAGHPLFAKDHYEDYEGVDVHGGVTFMDHCMNEANQETAVCHLVEAGDDDNVWWIGFDCNHCDDMAPQTRGFYENINKELPSHTPLETTYEYQTYKDINYVTEQTLNLALQLHGMRT